MTNQTVEPIPTALNQDFLISPNFHYYEFIASNTAEKLHINNTPTVTKRLNIIAATLGLFQPVRNLLGFAMLISSGFRCDALNDAVGGADDSAHRYGFAIDFRCPQFGNTRKIAKFLAEELKKAGIKFDQLILEFPDSPNSWIHIGYKNSQGQQRGQVLTAVKQGGKTRYLAGLH